METIWDDVRLRTKTFVKKPERFLLNKDSEDFEKSKILLKVFYDGVKLATGWSDGNEASQKTLQELIIEDFDEEQVWAGIELQNKFVVDECQEKLKRLQNLPINFAQQKDSSAASHIQPDSDGSFDELPTNEDPENELNDEDEESNNDNEISDEDVVEEESDIDDDNGEDIFNDPDFQHMSDSDLDDKLPLFDKNDSDDDDSNLEDEEKENEIEAKETELENKTSDYMANAMKAMKSHGGSTKVSVVEDQFFKLSEMENFLDAEDAKAMKDKVDKDDDDSIDYFGSDMEENESEVPTLMYKDLFGTAGEEGNNSPKHEPNPIKHNDLLESDDNAEDSENEEMGEMKSSHELRTLRLQKKIKEIETDAVKAKSWQMTGEVAAVERPENALLQEHLDYETVSKQAPIITEEVSKRLEDIIKQRIKDLAWDDVERKVKPVENPYDYKKKLILDQEKSKLSLAQVYEEEYLKQKGELEDSKKTPGMLDEEEEDKPETLDEIKKKMKDLFSKLDTLTHYNYTPQAAHADVKIIRNLPTISMEEVAPVAMNDANLLAPQEISDKKKGEDIGTSERTSTDKKRDLRLKKAKQRKIKKAKEQKLKLAEKLNPGLATKYSKKAAIKAIEQAEKEGKVKTIKEKNKATKSSKAFFDKMQNEVQGIVSDIKAEKLKKKKNKQTNVATLKL